VVGLPSAEMPVSLTSMDFLAPMTALIVLNLTIIIGNVMVIAAVFTHSKLRCTTTNKFAYVTITSQQTEL